MTVEEIFKNLSSHMVLGMMIHDQMANYYEFLGLSGYRECHEYHFLKETCSYRKLCAYYITHYNKLIEEMEFENPDVIPTSWYAYTRQDVDGSTKKNAVKNGLMKWIDWERKTKKLYESMYKELMELGEVASASFIKCFISDTTDELTKVEGYFLDKYAIGFDLDNILADQKSKHKKYRNEICTQFRGMEC